jgi:hypothetical protein
MAAAREVVSPESLERVLVRSLVQSFTDSLIECLRVPGAHTPARPATWTNDTPELKLNLSLVAEAFLQLLASGLGALALVWATVVLLGGFSTMLGTMDFWFTTAIVFVETARYGLMLLAQISIMLRFFADLQRLLFDPQDKDNPLRIEAGKALIALVASTSHGDVFPNIQQLVRIMSCDECSKDYRAVTAQILAQMCARSRLPSRSSG